MRLATLTDFNILKALSDRGRNTVVDLSYILDKNRSYISTRLPILTDYGLLARIGPVPNSGLCEITDKGLVVLDNRDQYRADDVDFDALVESEFRAWTDEANA